MTTEKTKTYVLGFCFDKQLSRVVLILKNRPDFLAGKLNGLGGKLEPYDTSCLTAMRREASEEANLHVDWRLSRIMHMAPGSCFVYYAVATDKQLSNLQTLTDEPVALYDLNDQLTNLDKVGLSELRAAYAKLVARLAVERESRWRASRSSWLKTKK